jgi:hypothetical protein
MIVTALLTALALSAGPAPQACQALSAWREVIQDHQARYPRMALADIYKLVHQGALGSEHAVESAMARQWLDEEISVLADGPAEVLVDTIAPGGTHVRIHLRPYLDGGGDPEALLNAFVETANAAVGSGDVGSEDVADAANGDTENADALSCATAAVYALAEDGALPWGVEVVARFFTAREEQGYPAEHHTRAYWSAYRPAYRVISGALVPALLATMGGDPDGELR